MATKKFSVIKKVSLFTIKVLMVIMGLVILNPIIFPLLNTTKSGRKNIARFFNTAPEECGWAYKSLFSLIKIGLWLIPKEWAATYVAQNEFGRSQSRRVLKHLKSASPEFKEEFWQQSDRAKMLLIETERQLTPRSVIFLVKLGKIKKLCQLLRENTPSLETSKTLLELYLELPIDLKGPLRILILKYGISAYVVKSHWEKISKDSFLKDLLQEREQRQKALNVAKMPENQARKNWSAYLAKQSKIYPSVMGLLTKEMFQQLQDNFIIGDELICELICTRRADLLKILLEKQELPERAKQLLISDPYISSLI